MRIVSKGPPANDTTVITHRVSRPSPVAACAARTQDVDVGGRASDRALDVLDSQACNRDARGRSAGRRSVLVVLFDDDAI